MYTLKNFKYINNIKTTNLTTVFSKRFINSENQTLCKRENFTGKISTTYNEIYTVILFIQKIKMNLEDITKTNDIR